MSSSILKRIRQRLVHHLRELRVKLALVYYLVLVFLLPWLLLVVAAPWLVKQAADRWLYRKTTARAIIVRLGQML